MSERAWVWIVATGLLCVGLVDALYLSYAHYAQDPLICGILEGCNAVAQSPYSKIFGVPIAYLGVLYYTGMLKMAFWKHYVPALSVWGHRLFVLGAYTGAAASVVFAYIQYALIGAFCIYCLLSATITWTVGALVFFVVQRTDVHDVVLADSTPS